MLKLSLKNTVNRHKGLIISMLILSVCSVLVCDIGVFSFNSQKQEVLKSQNETEFTVYYNGKFDNQLLSDKISEITNKYPKGLSTVYIKIESDPQVYLYYKGNDILNIGTLPKNESQIIIGSQTKSAGYEIGDVLTNDFGEFTVCGIRPMREYDEILPTALKSEVMISEICFKWDYVLSDYRNLKFKKLLNKTFNCTDIEVPQKIDLTQGLLLSMRSSVIICAIAVCNVMLSFSFLVKMKKHIYKIYYICGASKLRIYFNALAELMIYMIAGGTLGHLIYYILFSKTHTFYGGLGIFGFLISFAICICLCLITVTPVFIKSFAGTLTKDENNE